MEEEKKYKCDKCDGKGYIEDTIQIETIEIFNFDQKILFPGNSKAESCPKCLGVGELDWVEYIKGKKRNKYPNTFIGYKAGFVVGNLNTFIVHTHTHTAGKGCDGKRNKI